MIYNAETGYAARDSNPGPLTKSPRVASDGGVV